MAGKKTKDQEDYIRQLPAPQTINMAFGIFEDFRAMIKGKCRSRKIDIEQQIEDRVRLICDSIIKGAAETEIKEAEELIQYILSHQLDINEALIQTYTRESFLYRKLNKLLREEDWQGLSNLLPFLDYLLEALHQKLEEECMEHLRKEESLWEMILHKKKLPIYLYRGACLAEHQISSYDPQKIKYFAWNAFTSTSRSKKIANFFKSTKMQRGYCFVLFKIDITSNSADSLLYFPDQRQFLDIARYSSSPNEQEVIIFPGTIFETVQIKKESCARYIVHLKLVYLLQLTVKNRPSVDPRMLKPSWGTLEQNSSDSGEWSVHNLLDGHMPWLVKSLIENNSFCQRLILYQIRIGPEAMVQLMTTLCNCKALKQLRLDLEEFTEETAQAFCEFLPQTTIKHLELCITRYLCTRNLMKAIKFNGSFKNLNVLFLISYDSYPPQIKPFSAFCSALCQANLEKLYFKGIEFSSKNVENLKNYLSNTFIQSLEFKHCIIDKSEDYFHDLRQTIVTFENTEFGFTRKKSIIIGGAITLGLMIFIGYVLKLHYIFKYGF